MGGNRRDPLNRVEFTHLSKVLYPEAGITKLQVIKYFIHIAPRILPFLAGRPVVLTRYPGGPHAPVSQGLDRQGAGGLHP